MMRGIAAVLGRNGTAAALPALLLAPLPMAAETWRCMLQSPCDERRCDNTEIRFTIDADQFAPPLDRGDPPRRRVTQVRFGETSFEAEPIMSGETRGFWLQTADGRARLLTIRADGAALYSEDPSGQTWPGHCEGID
ncbi:hypothetical protein ACN2XU_17935 [Primorskyibacter sp. 2E107]|uniref:hypothetical protein n=1 Tax=Primorskyibacter sp. 2E107 TaxID=3403458 RepID=UPI003AF461C1